MSYNYDSDSEWIYDEWEDDDVCDDCGFRLDGIGFCPVCDYDNDDEERGDERDDN